jgi:hypothetical protein
MSYRRATGVYTTISDLICRNHHCALFINFCIREGTKIPTMMGMGVYRWPPLHRPGVTRTAHHVDSRFTGPVPITIITNSQPSLTSSPRHQYALTIKKSTPSHTDTPPTHRLNSAFPYIPTNPAATASQKRQAFTPMETTWFQPPPRLATPLSAMTRCSNSHYVEVNVHSRWPGRG